MRLVEKMDAGPLISQKQVDIFPDETRDKLEIRLAQLSTNSILQSVDEHVNHRINLHIQNESKASYTRLLKKEHGYIPAKILRMALEGHTFSSNDLPILLKDYVQKYGPRDYVHLIKSGEIIFNYYKALYPWPGIWTHIQTNQGDKRLKITKMYWKDNKLIFSKVQLEGKKETDFQTFNSAYSFLSPIK